MAASAPSLAQLRPRYSDDEGEPERAETEAQEAENPDAREGDAAAASAMAAGHDAAEAVDDSDSDDDRIISALDYIELHDGARCAMCWLMC